MQRLMRGVLAILAMLVGQSVFAAPPFQNAVPAPTSSPYLSLLNNRQATPYQTRVRPRLENEKRFSNSQLELDRLERQQQSLRPRLPPPSLGPLPNMRGASRYIRTTGHQTRFLDGRRFQEQLHYFPQRAR